MPANRPQISAEAQRAIFVESGHRCACCGAAFPLERAHIVPWRESRDHDAQNLLCLCANCHEMADRDWDRTTFYEYKRRPWVNRQWRFPSVDSDIDTGSAVSAPATQPAGPRPLNSAKDALLACYAHLTIESERWGLDATDADSLRFLQEAHSVTWTDVSGANVTRDVADSEKQEWLDDFRARIAAHLHSGISREVIGRRMDRIYSYFSVFGYNKHYAGFEAFLRSRLYQLARIEEFVQPPLDMPGWRQRFDAVGDSVWESALVSIESAVYMTYTDYQEAVISRFWSIDSAPTTALEPTARRADG